MPNRETPINQNHNIRPKQVLLVGLGGIGGRTVDRILSIMPEECKKYTNSIAIDTDLEELENLLPNIPSNNKIALGANSDTNQSITIGEYIRSNPSTTDWFVQGQHLDTIEKRNTAQGAKQIRMVSKVALAATNDRCGMQKTLNSIVSGFNKSDGAALGRGLLVMVVSSIAGGTGAGTVLQFPLYLEQAISDLFPDEDVQIECSMLLPGMFSRVQSTKNYAAGKTNAYAVIRELMSMNSGKITRGDLLPRTDFGEKAEKISPYSRVLFFDNTSMAGDTLEGDLDNVYIPKIADALNEYLFGAVSGKITSALDNTLSTVYETEGAAIFGSVGSANLVFPRSTYTQYAVANWVSKSVSKDWTEINEKAKQQFNEEYKKAVDNNAERPEKKTRLREIYCQLIDKDQAPFYRELRAQLKNTTKSGASSAGKPVLMGPSARDIVQEFWNNCRKYLLTYIAEDKTVSRAKNSLKEAVVNKTSKDVVIAKLKQYKEAVEKAVAIGYMHEKAVICPMEAENGKIYGDNKDTTTLYNFIKSKKLHPIMIKYFLCKLYELANINATGAIVPLIDETRLEGRGASFRRNLDDQISTIETSASAVAISNFAEYLCKDLDLYLDEYENMFDSLLIAVRIFEDKKKFCIRDLPLINDENSKVLAGGKLSMLYVWRNIENSISSGEDVFVIDDELDMKVHEIVYKNVVKQIMDIQNVKTHVGGEPLKIRTRYEDILSRELVVYYTTKLNKNYSHFFPKNVIEAALLECGLRNAYSREASLIDENLTFDFQTFIDRNPQPYNITAPEGNLVTDAEFLTSLLSATIGKGKPFCGRVESFVEDNNDGDYTNRLIIVNRSMLRSKEDMKNIDENGIPKKVYIQDALIDGVSTSKIGTYNINTKFVDEGISPDVITAVTSISALLPKNFVAFLPPDNSEHSPTKEHSYYTAYKTHIDNLTTKPNFITPHLHRNWHLSGMLCDLTEEHTDSYNDETARAFIYGFAFDLIKVTRNGIVEIGEIGVEEFYSVFNKKTYINTYNLLSPEEHSTLEKLDDVSKGNMMETLLVKIYDLLATAAPLREAVIARGDTLMAQQSLEKNPQFVKNCLTKENIDNVHFKCIIDVIGGYFKGTRQLSPAEIIRADYNVEGMLKFMLKTTFDVAMFISNDDIANVRNRYNFFVNAYYDTAVIDDPPKADKSTIVPVDLSADVDDEERQKMIDQFFTNIDMELDDGGAINPFCEGRFNRDIALGMVDVFLKTIN